MLIGTARVEIFTVGRKDRQFGLGGFWLDLDDLETRIIKTIPNCRGAAIFRRLVAAYWIPSTSANAVGELEVKMLISNALPHTQCPEESWRCSSYLLRRQASWNIKSLRRSTAPGL
ncbi:hypothetical protein F5B21DRAFT_460144 [Xylaria acuta]|nr:hypothetical protein F5B21DRAFT_460144 [Xylaria acuta]